MRDNAFLDIHVLHSVPFSNLNRDNIGTPKQMIYGGTTRSRISSQCTKRAARLWLENNTDLGKALRTRRLPQKVREQLTKSSEFEDSDAVKAVTAIFEGVGIKIKEVHVGSDEYAELQGDQLTFTTDKTALDLAEAITKHQDTILSENFKAKRANKALRNELLGPFEQHNTIIALCGRMLADLPGAHVDGALQVAHAFTTHASTPELDYFTAVDDMIQEENEETGAGHINVNEFTSGVFYRHATIGLGVLAKSLESSDSTAAEAINDTTNTAIKDTVAEASSSFVQAFTVSEPTGKQNTANAHTLPALIAVTLRSDRPVSYATAFEQPIQSQNGGYMTESIVRLSQHAESTTSFYGTDALNNAWFATLPDVTTNEISGLGTRCNSFQELIKNIERGVKELFDNTSQTIGADQTTLESS